MKLSLRALVPGLSLLFLALLGAALLVACGSEGDSGSETAAPATAAEEAAPEPEAATPAVASLPEAGVTWCGEAPCPCEEGSENPHYGKETLQKCKLSAPTVVQGVHCRPAEVAFYPEGGLVRCYLSESQPIGPYTCAERKVIEFHREGQFKGCYLAEMAQIDGLWCKDGTSLEADGSLRRCRVEQASEVQGFTLPAGHWITMAEGKIYRWEVTGEPQAFGELACTGGYNYLHPDGSLAKCKLANPASIEGQEFPADETVCFDPEGQLADCSTMSFRTV